MAAQAPKQATVFSIRVGPKQPKRTLYVVGCCYPPNSGLPLPPIGTRVRLVDQGFKPPVVDPKGDHVVIAPGALVRLDKGPHTQGWPNSEVGLRAVRETAARIPDAEVIRVRDWRGGPM